MGLACRGRAWTPKASNPFDTSGYLLLGCSLFSELLQAVLFRVPRNLPLDPVPRVVRTQLSDLLDLPAHCPLHAPAQVLQLGQLLLQFRVVLV